MTSSPSDLRREQVHADRLVRVRTVMADAGVDALLLSVGPDLPWLIGYEAMPLERLTMLFVPLHDAPTLVVPNLEVPRVVPEAENFTVVGWGETDDPIRMVADLVGAGGRRLGIGSAMHLAIGDRTWSRFTVLLQHRLPEATWRNASEVIGPLRAVKDASEIDALTRAGAAVDRIAADLQAGNIALVGRTEAEVSADLGRRILAEGHDRVNFAIVAAGANAASPHHEPGDRVIEQGEIVLCDFGGTMVDDTGAGYCSDITRCVHLGEPPAELAEMYALLLEAQAASVASAVVGATCEDVDAAARDIITAAGYGEQFVHRTGHGIGVEEHEDPYIVAGNTTVVAPGHAFSIEPGIYVPGRWGARLEDIVVATVDGPRPLNTADHGLAVIDA